MSLSKLELVEEFIDYITKEYSKDFYSFFRKQGYTPKEISNTAGWSNRKIARFSSEAIFSNIQNTLLDYLNDFSCKEHDYDHDYAFDCGAQQAVFIFEEDVYKITSEAEVCDKILAFKEYLGEYGHIIADTKYIEDYKGATIYKQERVDTNSYIERDEEKALSNGAGDLEYYIVDEELAIQIGAELDYNSETINELYGLFKDYSGCCNFDIHSENWGYKNGEVKIFDPFYID